MKSNLSQICKRLLPNLPMFAAKGRLLFIRPIEHALGGVYLNPSAFDPARFSVMAFIVPLFMPTNTIYFNVGKEVQNKRGIWDANDPRLMAELACAISEQALPFLEQISTPQGIAQTAAAIQKQGDPVVQEAIARAYVLAGDAERAVRELGRLESMIQDDQQYEPLLIDTRRLKTTVISNPKAATMELLECEDVTATALGIAEFRA